jgi:uracil-DNA glycosylase
MQGERELVRLLEWQIASGADEAIGDQPVDRYAVSARSSSPEPARPAKTPAPAETTALAETPARAETTTPAAQSNGTAQPARPPAPQLVARNQIERTARELAQAANSLAELRDAFAAFDGCPLKQTATNFVFADGNPAAALMIIGEAPGAEEDRRGVPFIGPAGKLLDRMLAAIGLDRDAAYITNILPWRPPGNRNPTDAEIAACMPFIERHIELVAPRVLVPVGGTSSKSLLNTREGIMKTRGRWFEYASPTMETPIAARPILHPAYLLRSPAQKRETWSDLLAISERLSETGSEIQPALSGDA